MGRLVLSESPRKGRARERERRCSYINISDNPCNIYDTASGLLRSVVAVLLVASVIYRKKERKGSKSPLLLYFLFSFATKKEMNQQHSFRPEAGQCNLLINKYYIFFFLPLPLSLSHSIQINKFIYLFASLLFSCSGGGFDFQRGERQCG